MYIETSGDATFTALLEGFDSSPAWAKAGVSEVHYFRVTTRCSYLLISDTKHFVTIE